MKHAGYGNVHPRTVLPFVVEHAGGINKGGMQLFEMCRDAADNAQAEYKGERPRPVLVASWSSKGGSLNFPAVTSIN